MIQASKASATGRHDSGFSGRLGAYEVMEVTPAIRRLIHQASPTHEIRAKFREGGGLSLRQEAVLIAIDGKTSLEEALLVTHNEDNETVPLATIAPHGAAPAKEAA